MIKRLLKLSAALFASVSVLAPIFAQGELVEIWKGLAMPGISTAKAETTTGSYEEGNFRYSGVPTPTIEVFLAKTEKPSGALVICPGGAYKLLGYQNNGTKIAKYYSERGINCFLLKYRIPQNRDGAFQDAQRAIRLVRHNAEKWNVDVNKVGIIGFSAGGHLSARVSTNGDVESYAPLDAADKLSPKPNFTVLVFPAYLADNKTYELKPEIRVAADTPPAFMLIAGDDKWIMGSSVGYYLALKKFNIPADFHIFQKGGHAFGLVPNNEHLAAWPELLTDWLKYNKFAE